MRWMHCTLVFLVLALGACADETEPTPTQATGSTPTFVAPTAQELAAYEVELAQIFAPPAVPITKASPAGGVVADVSGQANVALAKFNAEGVMDTTCVQSQQDAILFLSQAQASPRQLEVK